GFRELQPGRPEQLARLGEGDEEVELTAGQALLCRPGDPADGVRRAVGRGNRREPLDVLVLASVVDPWHVRCGGQAERVRTVLDDRRLHRLPPDATTSRSTRMRAVAP